MSKMNWSRDHDRRRMRIHGIEAARDEDTIVRPLLRRPFRPRRRLSKEELREQATAALLAWRERKQP